MKFRLKNREFQAQLDRLSRRDFSRRLDEWNGDRSQELVNFSFGEETGNELFPRTFETAIRTADIEEVPDYDPSRWNEWPNVQPPANVLMRVEILTQRYDQDGPEPRGGRPRFRGCAKFDGQYWDFKDMAHLSAGETVRFRPWEDKE